MARREPKREQLGAKMFADFVHLHHLHHFSALLPEQDKYVCSMVVALSAACAELSRDA